MEFESFEDMKKFLDDLGYEIQPKESKKRTMSNAEKQKAYRERKKVTEGNESVTKSNECYEEKREEERESFSPSSPSSLSSSPLIPPNNNPITPIIPSSQEKEEERKEISRAKSPKPVKNRHGEFGHVLLTPVEYSKICEQFDDADDRIRRLDEYLEMHRNKSYSNHYLTILNWARRDGDKPQEREKTTAEMIAELDWSKYDGSQTV